MPQFNRPCLICGELSKGTRCPAHERAYQSLRESKRNTPERQAKKQALYGGDYRRRRNFIVNNSTHCHLCKQAFIPGDRIQADHLIASDPNSPLAAAHAHCNESRGDKPLPTPPAV